MARRVKLVNVNIDLLIWLKEEYGVPMGEAEKRLTKALNTGNPIIEREVIFVNENGELV